MSCPIGTSSCPTRATSWPIRTSCRHPAAITIHNPQKRQHAVTLPARCLLCLWSQSSFLETVKAKKVKPNKLWAANLSAALRPSNSASHAAQEQAQALVMNNLGIEVDFNRDCTSCRRMRDCLEARFPRPMSCASVTLASAASSPSLSCVTERPPFGASMLDQKAPSSTMSRIPWLAAKSLHKCFKSKASSTRTSNAHCRQQQLKMMLTLGSNAVSQPSHCCLCHLIVEEESNTELEQGICLLRNIERTCQAANDRYAVCRPRSQFWTIFLGFLLGYHLMRSTYQEDASLCKHRTMRTEP